MIPKIDEWIAASDYVTLAAFTEHEIDYVRRERSSRLVLTTEKGIAVIVAPSI